MASSKMENEIHFHAKASRGLKPIQRKALSNCTCTCIINTDRPLVHGENLDVVIEKEGKLSILFLHEIDSNVLGEITLDSHKTIQVLEVCFKENTIQVTEKVHKTYQETINNVVEEKIRLQFQITAGKVRITLLNGSQGQEGVEEVTTEEQKNTNPIHLVPLIEEQVSISMLGTSGSPAQLLNVGFSDREVLAREQIVLKIRKQNSERGTCRIMLAPADIMKRILSSPHDVVPQILCRALERRSVLVKTMELSNDMLELTGIVDFHQKGWPIFYIENVTVCLDQGIQGKHRSKDSLNNDRKMDIGMGTVRTSLQNLHAAFEEHKKETSKDSRELKQELQSLTKAVEDVKETKRGSKPSCVLNKSLQLLDRWITPHYNSLCRGINLEDLLPHLLQDGLLTDAQHSRIINIPNHSDQVQKLYEFLKRQPETKRNALVQALKKSNSNEHIIPYFQDSV